MLKLKEEELGELLQNFYEVSGMKPGVYDIDFNEIAYAPKKWFALCDYMRTKSPEFDAACRRCDEENMIRCRKAKEPMLYRCHCGLWEYLTPLQYEGVIIGFAFIGQSTDGSETEYKLIEENAMKYGFTAEEIKEQYDQLDHYPVKRVKAACSLLDACVSHIYHQKMLEVRYMDLAQQIEQYISENITWDLSTEHLCDKFRCSRSELYRVFNENFNTSVAEYIRNKRLVLAEASIRRTNMQISDIAASVGYFDYNYFTKVFKKKYGLSPREYRKHLNLEK